VRRVLMRTSPGLNRKDSADNAGRRRVNQERSRSIGTELRKKTNCLKRRNARPRTCRGKGKGAKTGNNKGIINTRCEKRGRESVEASTVRRLEPNEDCAWRSSTGRANP